MEDNFNDVDIMREIIGLSKEIGMIYSKIITEDLSSKKSSLEYYNLLLKLKEYKTEETELYEYLELDDERVAEIKEYLGHLAVLHGFSNIGLGFYSSFNRNIQELWLYRIFDKLSFYNSEYKCYFDKVIKGKIDGEELSYVQSIIFNNILNEDFINSFFYFLNLEKLECKDIYLKKHFTNIQYNLSFINSNIEEQFLKYGIDGEKDLYLKFDMMGDIIRLPKDKKDEQRETKAYNYVVYAVERIIQLLDLEREDTVNLQKVYSIYLRAALPLFFVSSDYGNVILDIKKQVNEYEEERGVENNMLDSLVCNYLDSNNPDKAKCKYLSIFNVK